MGGLGGGLATGPSEWGGSWSGGRCGLSERTLSSLGAPGFEMRLVELGGFELLGFC